MFVNKLFTYIMCVCLKSKRYFNVKSSAYHFYVKTEILADFQICISVPLRNVSLHCQPVYGHRVHRVMKTAMTVMILVTALKQTQQNLKMMINCF